METEPRFSVRDAKLVFDGLSEIVVAFRRSEIEDNEDTVPRPTLPVNPLTLVSAIVAVPDEPCVRVRLLTDNVMEKSCTNTVTTVECDIDPLLPVTVMV